uniref:Copper-containing nitrite reductase n=1 Tax=Echinostoma caproni TaxID=27848 RepID=A0A183A2Q4_9TREM
LAWACRRLGVYTHSGQSGSGNGCWARLYPPFRLHASAFRTRLRIAPIASPTHTVYYY